MDIERREKLNIPNTPPRLDEISLENIKDEDFKESLGLEGSEDITAQSPLERRAMAREGLAEKAEKRADRIQADQIDK